jgi:hypothetical protein
MSGFHPFCEKCMVAEVRRITSILINTSFDGIREWETYARAKIVKLQYTASCRNCKERADYLVDQE